ncbi:phosphatidylinositol phosphatase PTPRQ-like [Gigantopelta aegis]|uniref:phosphatidylinositol phosphatase PTPRQ-like n=1 Tax=Gigantopelta aegis TaxID=1735272 RepID=UPI001B88B835|nr:phosphatidylinositol phosphatase PTPRQ-like [Gigantopelta aegis]
MSGPAVIWWILCTSWLHVLSSNVWCTTYPLMSSDYDLTTVSGDSDLSVSGQSLTYNYSQTPIETSSLKTNSDEPPSSHSDSSVIRSTHFTSYESSPADSSGKLDIAVTNFVPDQSKSHKHDNTTTNMDETIQTKNQAVQTTSVIDVYDPSSSEAKDVYGKVEPSTPFVLGSSSASSGAEQITSSGEDGPTTLSGIVQSVRTESTKRSSARTASGHMRTTVYSPRHSTRAETNTPAATLSIISDQTSTDEPLTDTLLTYNSYSGDSSSTSFSTDQYGLTSSKVIHSTQKSVPDFSESAATADRSSPKATQQPQDVTTLKPPQATPTRPVTSVPLTSEGSMKSESTGTQFIRHRSTPASGSKTTAAPTEVPASTARAQDAQTSSAEPPTTGHVTTSPPPFVTSGRTDDVLSDSTTAMTISDTPGPRAATSTLITMMTTTTTGTPRPGTSAKKYTGSPTSQFTTEKPSSEVTTATKQLSTESKHDASLTPTLSSIIMMASTTYKTTTTTMPSSTTPLCANNQLYHNSVCIGVDELIPVNMTLKSSGGQNFEVHWTGSKVASEIITNYVVIWSNDTSSYNMTSPCNKTCVQEITITVPGSVWNVSVIPIKPDLDVPGANVILKTNPAAVSGLTVSASETTISARWNYTQGTLVANFHVIISSDNFNIKMTSNEYRVSKDGLEPGKCYKLEVTAVNEAGVSESKNSEICTEESIPTSVRNISYSNITSKSVRLQWKPPEPPNGVITKYLIKYCLRSNGVSKSCRNRSTSSNETTFEVTGLRPHQEYSFRLLASTSKGYGKSWSKELTKKTREDVPGKVTSVTIELVKQKEIHISWGPPSRSNGIVLGYTVMISAVNGTFKRIFSVNNTKPLLVNVIPNSQYSIQVFAETKAGKGKAETYNILVQKISKKKFILDIVQIKHETKGSYFQCHDELIKVEVAREFTYKDITPPRVL